MKFAIATLLSLAVFADAQTPSQCASIAQSIPACATSCISTAANGVGCNKDDFSCQCKNNNPAAIASAAYSCLTAACSSNPSDILTAQSVASSVCACATNAPVGGSSGGTDAGGGGGGGGGSSSAKVTSDAAAGGSPTPTGMSAVTTAAAALVSSTASVPGAINGTGGLIRPTTSFVPFTSGAVAAASSIGGVICILLALLVVL